MQSNSSPLINILSYGLPGAVTHPLYLEYKSRKRELERIMAEPNNNYQEMVKYAETVDSLLAVCLFYRHVMGHLQGATSFYYSVNKQCTKEVERPIRVGRCVLDKEQQGHLFSAVLSFSSIRARYQLDSTLFDFSETIQFLRKCKELFYRDDYEEDDTI